MKTGFPKHLLVAASLAVASLSAAPALAADPATTFGEVEAVKIEASVTKVDLEKRLVTVKLANGKHRTVSVGPNAQNLDQVKVGDKVEIVIADSAVLDLQRPTSNTPTFSVEELAGKAPPGEKPAGFAAVKITAIVELTHVDAATGELSFVGPMGNPHTVVVKDPRFQATMKDFKVGDYAQVAYVEAVALAVVPKK